MQACFLRESHPACVGNRRGVDLAGLKRFQSKLRVADGSKLQVLWVNSQPTQHGSGECIVERSRLPDPVRYPFQVLKRLDAVARDDDVRQRSGWRGDCPEARFAAGVQLQEGFERDFGEVSLPGGEGGDRHRRPVHAQQSYVYPFAREIAKPLSEFNYRCGDQGRRRLGHDHRERKSRCAQQQRKQQSKNETPYHADQRAPRTKEMSPHRRGQRNSIISRIRILRKVSASHSAAAAPGAAPHRRDESSFIFFRFC